jgi:hypothetical protein
MSSLHLRQLLWTVNISLCRKLTLMVLFSGAIFVIMAAIIRAVVILSVRHRSIAGDYHEMRWT